MKLISLDALLHDAAEAYVSDVARPIKRQIPFFKEIENDVLQTIYKHLGRKLPPKDYEDEIKIMDLRMLRTERDQLMKPPGRPWDECEDIAPYDVTLPCWDWRTAKKEWLKMYELLISI